MREWLLRHGGLLVCFGSPETSAEGLGDFQVLGCWTCPPEMALEAPSPLSVS